GIGGAEGDRTPDLRIANAALSQLSYGPTGWTAGVYVMGKPDGVKHVERARPGNLTRGASRAGKVRRGAIDRAGRRLANSRQGSAHPTDRTGTPMSYTDISYETLGAVARICHNRPKNRNAESQRLLQELDDAMRQAAADPDIRVVILGGQGDHFSAGHDLKEAQESRADFTVEQRFAYEERYYYEYAMRIWDHPKPTIAQVQGACIAGGFMVANMCDLVVASDDAFFADPVCHTLSASAVEMLVHPWVMGMRAAKEFLFTGRRMDAAEAHRIGM